MSHLLKEELIQLGRAVPLFPCPISVSGIYVLANRGDLETVRQGKKRFTSRQAIERFIRRSNRKVA